MQSDSVMLAGVLNVLSSAGKLKTVGEAGHIPGYPSTPRRSRSRRSGRAWLDASRCRSRSSLCEVGRHLSAGRGGRPGARLRPDRPRQRGSSTTKGNPMDSAARSGPSPRIRASNPKLWGKRVKEVMRSRARHFFMTAGLASDGRPGGLPSNTLPRPRGSPSASAQARRCAAYRSRSRRAIRGRSSAGTAPANRRWLPSSTAS